MTFLISVYAWVIGGLYFIILCFLSIALSFFLRPKTFDPIIKKSLRLFFKILFIKVHSKGEENIQLNTNYLIYVQSLQSI